MHAQIRDRLEQLANKNTDLGFIAQVLLDIHEEAYEAFELVKHDISKIRSEVES